MNRMILFRLPVLERCLMRSARRAFDTGRQNASKREKDCQECRWGRGIRWDSLIHLRGGGLLQLHSTLLPVAIMDELRLINRITLVRRRSCATPEAMSNPYHGGNYSQQRA